MISKRKKTISVLLAVFLTLLSGLCIFMYRFYPEIKIKTELPREISAHRQSKHHVQGIAIDTNGKYIYYSFTDRIVKSDLDGNIIGCIKGFVGHIGCIAFNENDNKVYASLEYKHDSIGQSLINDESNSTAFSDGFYIAIFDVEKIVQGDYDISDHPDMIKAVHLSEVLKDYNGTGLNSKGDTVEHRYGCSGIDGLCFAPLPGGNKHDYYLYVAYGIYSDTTRRDNDHQVILCYDSKKFSTFAQNFNQNSMHRNGPDDYDYKFFVYTGNTKYGVQNMTYDKSSDIILMATYPGFKNEFENYSLFAVDMSEKPIESELHGLKEKGYTLTLKSSSNATGNSPNGWHSEIGKYGLCSVGYGYYYLAESIKDEDMHSAEVQLYYFDTEKGFVSAEKTK